MAVVSIAEAARITGHARSTLYRRISSGELSTAKQEDGSKGIDTSELFRVFGEPNSSDTATPDSTSDVASQRRATRGEPQALQAQVDLLQEQLKEAREREERLLRMVEQSQRLLQPPQRRGFIERIADAIRRTRGED
jgi:transcriptional regulator of acetoin/glycerol metabolism